VDEHGEDVLARHAAVLGVGAVADAISLHLVARGAAGYQGVAVLGQRHVAALRQRQRFGEPLGVGLRAQRFSGLRAKALPGNEGVVFVAVQGGNILGRAGGDGVW
jgi:hypothetical protein